MKPFHCHGKMSLEANARGVLVRSGRFFQMALSETEAEGSA